MDIEYWFLDDAERPWLIRVEGQQGEKSYMQQLGCVVEPGERLKGDLAAALSHPVPGAGGFLAAPGLTSHYASAAGSYHLTFGGGAGITATGTDVKTESSLTGTNETTSKQVTSLGVSAVLVAAQLPRIGFGLGLLNTSAVAYVDHVIATSVVTAGGTSLIPCRRYQINSSFGAGVGVQLLGIKVPGLGSKKTLGTPYDKVVTEPEGMNCGG